MTFPLPKHCGDVGDCEVQTCFKNLWANRLNLPCKSQSRDLIFSQGCAGIGLNPQTEIVSQRSVKLLSVSAAQVTSSPHQLFHMQCGGNKSSVQQRIQRFRCWVFVRQRHRDACAFVRLHLALAHLVPPLQLSVCSHSCEWVHAWAQHS